MRCCFLILLILTLSGHAYGVPNYLRNQGHILNGDNEPITGSANMTFKLYAGATGGSALWTQTLAATFDNGYYSVILGPGTPTLSSDLFDRSTIYLGIAIEGALEFSPRTRVVSVPYALHAGSVSGSVNAIGGLSIDGQEVFDDSGNLLVPGTIASGGALTLPQGEMGDLPMASEDNSGQIYFATDTGKLYYSDGTEWVEVGGAGGVMAPMILNVDPPQIEPGADVTITIQGQAFEDGCEVEFDSVFSPNVEFINSGEVQASSTELSSGVYNVKVANPVGLRGILTDGLSVDATPVWETTEGSLGTALDSFDGEHFTLQVSDDEGQPITFELISGQLPDGLDLDNNSGIIYGDPDDVSEDTEFAFVIQATDTAAIPHQINGSFAIIVTHRIGQDSSFPGITCKTILDHGSSQGDGLYWIDPNGEAPDDSFQVFCDMTSDDGGWTLVAALGPGGRGETEFGGTMVAGETSTKPTGRTVPPSNQVFKFSDAVINQIKDSSATAPGIKYETTAGNKYGRGDCSWASVTALTLSNSECLKFMTSYSSNPTWTNGTCTDCGTIGGCPGSGLGLSGPGGSCVSGVGNMAFSLLDCGSRTDNHFHRHWCGDGPSGYLWVR